jgi:hypothetical protein
LCGCGYSGLKNRQLLTRKYSDTLLLVHGTRADHNRESL